MNDLSLFILDIVQNSFTANSTLVELIIDENKDDNLLTIKIIDNGCGIKEKDLIKITDPFYTTRKTRNVGLGIPLFKEICERANGDLDIKSTHKLGTTIEATMEYNHIDRLPLGNIAESIYTLFINDYADVSYIHFINNKKFELKTIDMKSILDGLSIKNYKVMQWLKDYIDQELHKIEEEK